MNRLPVTAVVITLNEASNIEACLRPLLACCAEVLVADSGSTDGTPEQAEQLGARVLRTEWRGYAQTKNKANEAARHDWILSIDADEVLSGELEKHLRSLPLQEKTVYALDRFTNYCGTWVRHSGWYPDWKVRLFDRRAVRWEGDFVHETLSIPADFSEVRLSGKLFHYSYRSSEDHWNRIERYARLSAEKLFDKGKRPNVFKQLFSPPARFLRTFFLKKGFLDGRVGWRLSLRNAYMVRKKYQILKDLYRQQQHHERD